MAGNMVPLKKETGGCTLSHDGEEYTWARDGSVVQVPYEWALELLAVPGGGFEVADEKKMGKAASDAEAEAAKDAPEDDHGEGVLPEVTEPAPGVEGRITEPAPEAKHPASPITPKTTAGTRTRK